MTISYSKLSLRIIGPFQVDRGSDKCHRLLHWCTGKAKMKCVFPILKLLESLTSLIHAQRTTEANGYFGQGDKSHRGPCWSGESKQKPSKQKAVFTHRHFLYPAWPGTSRWEHPAVAAWLPSKAGIRWWCGGWSGRLVSADGWMRRR